MSSPKTIKKGEFLFKEGDKITALSLVQSGGVNICISRPKKNIEMLQIGPGNVLGETALLGATTHPFSALATAETHVVEVPTDIFKQQIDQLPATLKVLNKSLNERLKLTLNELKGYKLEKDASPCPEEKVANVYGCIFHTTNHKGTKDNEGRHTIEWSFLRQYSQKVFNQSIKQMENAINVLVKLKLAQFEMGKNPENPDGPDEIQKVIFFNLGLVENFFEFYQYYYYKPGKQDILKVEEGMYNLLKNILTCAEGETPDRNGVVSLDYTKMMERFKTEWGITLNNDHFGRLEQKGVYAKRAAKSDGTTLFQFDLKEWQNILFIWRVLKEIEKWNEKGFVDPNEQEVSNKKTSTAGKCPKCNCDTVEGAKFCSECGSKLA